MPPACRPLFLLLFAAACATTPAARCAGPETRELRTVEQLIAETRLRLDRGYALARQGSGARVNVCLGGFESNVGVSFCADPGARTRPVAIDTAAEERKLAALEARRQTLQARIAALTAACARP